MHEIAVCDVEHDLDRYIAAFEAAQYDRGFANLADFLPDRNNPLYMQVLRELVRVDLEYTWTWGQARRLDHYRRLYPELFDDPQNVHAICFEEFRLRRQAGERVSADEYNRHYGVDSHAWIEPMQPVGTNGAECDRPNDLAKSSWTSILTAAPSAEVNGSSSLGTMPRPGETLLGFELVGELGRGTFATVFLARQPSLSDRFVALKISLARVEESGILARLQHTNIVPVYSVHRAGPLQVICMPFYGSTTLADVIRELRVQGSMPASGKTLVETLCSRSTIRCRDQHAQPVVGTVSATKQNELDPTTSSLPTFRPSSVATCLKSLSGLSYVEAVLWIGSRLAEGLHHAHQRGILHRDLKPANVLLADDGQPMLLDFNLSEDVRAGMGISAEFVGGTLPYMAPEILLAFEHGARAGDARSDVYSLGVILFELLAGRPPYPAYKGPRHDVLRRMFADRHNSIPKVRCWNKTVSPAVEAIVQKCLANEPGRRYTSADDLREDLERQLKSQPLCHVPEPSWRERAGKWVHRHPRLTSASSIAVVAGLLVAILAGGLAYRGARLVRLEALENLAQFQNDLRAVQTLFLDTPIAGQQSLNASSEACERALLCYGVMQDPAWQALPRFRSLSSGQQAVIRDNVGELLFYLAAMEGLKADIVNPLSPDDEHVARAVDLNRRAEACYAAGDVPGALWQQRAVLAQRQGKASEAREAFAKAAASPPRTTRDFGMAACILMSQRRFRAALPLWQKASASDPQNIWVWYGLGHCYNQLSQPAQAAACYTACIALKPDFHGWYFSRGLIYLKQKEYSLAASDFDDALRLRPDHVEARFNRALAWFGGNRYQEAIADLDDMIRQRHAEVRTYFLLAQAQDRLGDMKSAARTRLAAMHCEPADDRGWVSRAVARANDDPAAAVGDLDHALQCNAFCLPAFESKAHLLAERLGRTEDAVRVLDRAVTMYPENASLLSSRGVLLARLRHNEAARRDAEAALTLDQSAPSVYQVAGIYALSSPQEPGDVDRAIALLASALRNGYGNDLITTDKDLDPIRHRPQFQQLLQAIRTLHPIPSALFTDSAGQPIAD